MRLDGGVKTITLPSCDESEISKLHVGDRVLLTGTLLCGRDAVLPRVCRLIKEDRLGSEGIDLRGACVFHTAVSPAGVGPTSSNKLEIESSIPLLSGAGVKIHLGKGAISADTVRELERYGAVFAVIPPVSALLTEQIESRRLIAFPELGMEALYEIRIRAYPVIIAASHGESIYDRKPS